MRRLASCPNSVEAPVRQMTACPVPLTTCAGEEDIASLAGGTVGSNEGRSLFHRECFAGKGGFVDEEIVRGQQSSVRRDRRTCRQKKNVSRDDVIGEDVLFLFVPPDGSANTDHRKQFGQSLGGAPFLNKAEECTRDDDDENDRRIDTISKKCGENNRPEQEKCNGAFELREEQSERV